MSELIEATLHESDRAKILPIVRRAVLECAIQHPHSAHPVGGAEELFHSPSAQAIKEEIVRTGRKLWQRQYVDGNGGNISVRVSEEYVICTPTLLSKGDLQVGDLALVDMQNRQVFGPGPHTSEILLHLEVYKAVPQAKAVIHCHPPYATAHAIAGVVPQGNLVPEQEVFVGPVALSPYETPGTVAFARTILPFVKDHNTILLANHGVVCWADTVTHAEWYVEIVDTYCKTILIASQLQPILREIPPGKIADLLAIKKGLGLSDPRLGVNLVAEPEKSAARLDRHAEESAYARLAADDGQNAAKIDPLVNLLVDQVMEFLRKNN